MPSPRIRRALAHGDVRRRARRVRPVGETRVVTPDEEAATAARAAGAEPVADPGGGQGAAVQAGVEGVAPGAILVVNADVPCVGPTISVRSSPRRRLAPSRSSRPLDGTTNAVSLPSAACVRAALRSGQRGSLPRARRVAGLEAVSVAVPDLADDVDTMDDLTRLRHRAGPRTQACLVELERSVA